MSNHDFQEMSRLIEKAQKESSREKAEARLKASGYLKPDGRVDERYRDLELSSAA